MARTPTLAEAPLSPAGYTASLYTVGYTYTVQHVDMMARTPSLAEAPLSAAGYTAHLCTVGYTYTARRSRFKLYMVHPKSK